MGVSGHVPGTFESQNLRIGMHCMQMSVTCVCQPSHVIVIIFKGVQRTLTIIQPADNANRIRMGHRILDRENIRQ